MATGPSAALLKTLVSCSEHFARQSSFLSASQSLHPPPTPAPTPLQIQSDLLNLLPSLKHDVTALSLALGSEELSKGTRETLEGGKKLADGAREKMDKVALAVSWHPTETGGKLKAKHLLWATLELLSSLGSLCSSHAKHLESRGATKAREAVLRDTGRTWEAIDDLVKAAEADERVAVNKAWSDMAKTIDDALDEAKELLESEDDTTEPPDGEDVDDLSFHSTPLLATEKDRIRASFPVLKLLRLLLRKLQTLNTLFASISISDLDRIYDTTGAVLALVDELVEGFEGPQDVDTLRSVILNIHSKSVDIATALTPPLDQTATLAKTLQQVSLTDNPMPPTPKSEEEKDREWVRLWSVQLGLAVEKLREI